MCHQVDLHYFKKYNKFKKRHKNMSVYLLLCFRDIRISDVVTVSEWRPLPKTIKFNKLIAKTKRRKKA